MTHVASFTDAEEKLIRSMSDLRDKGATRIDTKEIAEFFEGNYQKAYQVAQRLKTYGLLDSGDCIDEWTIESLVLNAVYQWDHPEPKDYWKAISNWFKSKWWSIPVLIVFVCLPLIVQWIEMIRSVLTWVGAVDGK